MVDKKLTRIPNFSSAEKESLMMIALKYASILEDKKTNRSGLEEKSEAWKKIETEFNNTAPILAFRSQEQLKRLYENRKKDLRKKLADHKKETYLTGGGPAPKDIVLDKVDSLLSQILNEKSVKGFHSEFDSDNMYQENNTLPMSVSVNENFEPSLKKKKTVGQASNNLELDPEEAIEIFEFVPLERTESENIVRISCFRAHTFYSKKHFFICQYRSIEVTDVPQQSYKNQFIQNYYPTQKPPPAQH